MTIADHDEASWTRATWPSAKILYAVSACTALATRHPRRMKRDEIASATTAPRAFLSSILWELSAAGIVDARRGHYGGYVLRHDPAAIAIADVLAAVTSGSRFELRAPTSTSPEVDALFRDLAATIRARLEATSLADLVR